jgi:hypothetical protein
MSEESNLFINNKKFIEDKLSRQAKRGNKIYPCEMLYVDTRLLPYT